MLVCAEKPMGMAVSSFAKQMQVEVADLRRESVGIVRDVLAMAVVAPDQAMVARQCPSIAAPLEDIAAGQSRHLLPVLGDADFRRQRG